MSGSIRDSRERWIQAVGYEVGGIVVMTPLCSALSLLEPQTSAGLLAVLSLVVMTWSVVFNAIFDRLELGWSGRPASDRPHGLRLVHAALFEATAVVATCPLIIGFTGWSFTHALGADLALGLLYAAYGYAFHWSYDRWRPVAAERPAAARVEARSLPRAVVARVVAPVAAHPFARACSPYFPSIPMM